MGQCARYEKFDLHLSPDVEDKLKLGIGIDVDKIGKTCGEEALRAVQSFLWERGIERKRDRIRDVLGRFTKD